jgi:predicted MPP superfamily phosphohydrolase
MKITRRRFLISAATLGAGLGATYYYSSKFEPEFLEVTRHSVTGYGLKKPLKLLHLSDLHLSKCVPLSFIERALIGGMNENPDLVFLTGDFITGALEHADEYSRLLRRISSVVPTYASLGNHDGGIWGESRAGKDWQPEVEELLKQGGVQLLMNERVSLEFSHGVEIAGLGDLWNQQCHPERCLSRKGSRRDSRAPVLLLSHNPDSRTLLGDYIWDLMFCGHTHGGQVVIPLINWRPFLSRSERRCAEGLFVWEGHRIFVTRGVGNLKGFRFNCRPEISILELS